MVFGLYMLNKACVKATYTTFMDSTVTQRRTGDKSRYSNASFNRKSTDGRL